MKKSSSCSSGSRKIGEKAALRAEAGVWLQMRVAPSLMNSPICISYICKHEKVVALILIFFKTKSCELAFY